MERQRETQKKRGWLITSVSLMLLSACLMTSLTFALLHNSKTQQAVERTHEQNLYELGDNLTNVEINLSKLMVAPDGQYAAVLLTDIYSSALAAEKALASLPVDWHAAEDAAGFLNRVADFAACYQKALVGGRSGKGFAGNVEDMYVTARQLNAEIGNSVALVAQNKLDIRKITSAKPYNYRYRAGESIAHNSVEYPEMIYDGPFSDGRTDDVYRLFEGAPYVTLDEAKEIALSVLPEWQNKRVQSVGKSEKEPLYEITVSSDNGNAYMSIGEHGGKVVNFTAWRDMGNVMLGEASAKACAKDFAARLGYDVEPVWYLATGGVAYVNLAPIENDVVLYTDLVKVKVALDNGEALGLEAKNYCLNHTQRDMRLVMNRAAVPKLIDGRLQLNNVRGALIPLEGDEARLCYEAACEYKGLDYFVYIDAVTGETVQILRTVDSDQGSMVM
ncbi:MAG: hypothetical protein HFE46_07905 [Clostridia bacterium]|nr:hypothetical protein [Clostridia bacterium]